MTSTTIQGRITLLLLAAGFCMMAAPAVHAQALPPDEDQEIAASGADDVDAGEVASELDWGLLGANVAAVTTVPAAKTLPPKRPVGDGLSWSSKDKANGASDLSVKQALSPFWDTRIGADMTVVHRPEILTSADLLRRKFSRRQPAAAILRHRLGGDHRSRRRLDLGQDRDRSPRSIPAQEQSRLGTTLSKSLPLGEQYSLTLQNGYNIIQQGMCRCPASSPPGAQLRDRATRRS